MNTGIFVYSVSSRLEWCQIKEFGWSLDSTVLAASLEDGGPPGLLLAEAHVVLGPMVLLDVDEQQ